MVSAGAVPEVGGLAVEVLEAAASTVVRGSPELGPGLLGADRVSVPECPGTFGGIAIFATIAGSVIGSSSSWNLAIRSFTVRITTATILTGITRTAIILMDMIRTATDTGDTNTILTINLVTKVLRLGEVPRFEKFRCVWRGQAITAARSTESWVLEHAMQFELTNVHIILA